MNEYYVEETGQELDGYGIHFFRQHVQPCTFGAGAHIHDAIELIFIESGYYQIFVNGVEYTALPGDVFLFRANVIHSIYTGSPAENRYYVLKIRPSVIFEYSSEKNAMNYVMQFVVSDSKGKVRWTADELAEGEIRASFCRLAEAWRNDGPCKDILLKICAGQVIYALLSDFLKNRELQKEKELVNEGAAVQIYKAIRYINRNYSSDIDARQISEMVNMSYSYFSRCFKKITGRSFKEYLNEVRINRAEHLLVTTDMSVTRVAAECGYNNVSYFIAVYKSMKDRTPLANRKEVM